MGQNNQYDDFDSGRSRRRRGRKRKHCFIVLLPVFLIMTSITVLAMQAFPERMENGETDCVLMTEPQTEPSISIVRESEQPDSDHEKMEVETGYDYTKPVPESERAETSYFDDAVFIGDSRTEGLILYTGLSNAISYTNKGLMVDTVFTRPVINKNGEKISVMDALRQTDFNKVYIMLGINETGWPYDSVFIEKYGEIIDEIRSINPQAIIYVQEILPVTSSLSQTHRYVKNEKINAFNSLIRQMAEEKQIYYIDTGKAVSDEAGCLPEEAAIDGIHLKQSYCEKWLDYLKTHTITETGR